MRFFYRTVIFFVITLLVVSCDINRASETSATPEIGAALAQQPQQNRRVAIVHSQATKASFYDPFAYNQLFAAVQNQSMMAGIPFDLLDETALASTATLTDYDAIILPSFTLVSEANRSAITTRLLNAQENGVGILTSGELMSIKDDGTEFTDPDSSMTEILGVQPVAWLDGVSASVTVANNTHPIGKTYQAGEELSSYAQMWFANFMPVAGEQSTTLTHIKSAGVEYNGAQIIERNGPVVHFSTEQVLADNNQLWRVIQWMVYDDIAPASLQASRSDHVFLARNDMDQAMIAAELALTEIPLLEILKEWKQQYNFVGSYYIDIGNNPAEGEYTDWGVSAPLYQDYIALGNEIGSHSWTHPHYTTELTAAGLEFEFKDSVAEIGTQIGVPVVGAAIPGNPESLLVVETLMPWLDYLSGRSGIVGAGYPGAIGFLEPQHDMVYFSLNMSPDYSLIDFLGNTADQAQAIWKTEIDGILKHAQTPIVHWLWHDYGPTTQTTAGIYSKAMFTETIAYAASLGAEFTTLQNMQERIRTFAGVKLSVGSADVVTANVDATGVGQFAIKISEDEKISGVADWYAYDDDKVFLPDNGGQFEISVGANAADVTRITKLPMRARLLELTGDGETLSFSMQGEGQVTITLSSSMVKNTSVSGATSFTEDNGVLTLNFESIGTHQVDIAVKSENTENTAPVATAAVFNAQSESPTPITLAGVDADGDTLSYEIQIQPSNGSLTGDAPSILYASNPGFTGADSFSFVVNDATVNSAIAQIDINVAEGSTADNVAPVAISKSVTTESEALTSITLTAADENNDALNYEIKIQPSNGTLTGTAPSLVYASSPGFSGTDSFSFVANDGTFDSAITQITIKVTSRASTATTLTTPTTLDADGDRIPDSIEGTSDMDQDGVPNYLDLDSDGDSITDVIEGDSDLDGDSFGNYVDIDSDGDNIPDYIELTIDSDADTKPNYLDLDSDGDTIPDAIETAADTDADGTPNYLDYDSNGNSISDTKELLLDKDFDNIPDFMDLDFTNSELQKYENGPIAGSGCSISVSNAKDPLLPLTLLAGFFGIARRRKRSQLNPRVA